jgi:hypothetical protein
MRRRRHQNVTFKRFYALVLFAAFPVGYWIAGWNTIALRSDGPSAADTVASRFPAEWNKTSPAANLVAEIKKPFTAAASVTREARVLFDPKPMDPGHRASPVGISPIRSQPAAPVVAQAPAAPAPVQVAAVESAPMPSVANVATPAVQPHPAPRPVSAAKPAEQRRVANRPGYMFNDAQIASIKDRLNLTPDQEGMWPAVETALRNMTYTHPKGPAGAPSDDAQVASVDPDSVQNLKYAATPLILSFSDEQKDQVRDIAHVMGLDQLASQF